MEPFEAQPLIRVHSDEVVGSCVQQYVWQATVAEIVQPREGEETPEPPPLRRRIDRDEVYLTDAGFGFGTDLGPMKTQQ